MQQVRCSHCHRVYDIGKVEVLARYADCTVFKTPCCGREADDRTWKIFPDFVEIKESNEAFDEFGFRRTAI